MERPQACLRLSIFVILAGAAAAQPWVSLDPLGSFDTQPQLVYRSTAHGDRIMDFSAVGYGGGRRPIPSAPPVKVTLAPCGEDDTDALQAAINTVSAMQEDEQGFRGTIKLSAGTFNLGKQSIVINASGVVIDGSGVEQTLINAHALEAEVLFRIHGKPAEKLDTTPAATILKTVPSGTKTLTLSSVSGFSEGDQVSITWIWSREWIEMMNMSAYWKPGYDHSAERIVASVSAADSSIELDIPLPFRIDMKYIGNTSAKVEKISTSSRISHVALRNFKAVKRIVFPGRGCFLKMQDVEDSWITDLELHDFSGTILKHAPEFLHTSIAIGEAGDGIAGPNVFHNCTALGESFAQPHMKLATGLLYDNVRVPYGGIEMINRRWFGSGHGIAVGFSVAWNTESMSLQVISSPGAGFVDAASDPRIPSLFLAQRQAAGMPTVF